MNATEGREAASKLCVFAGKVAFIDLNNEL
jgi:hypothetical protein